MSEADSLAIRSRRILQLVAAVLAASGVFHLLVWAVLGGPWAGDVSWRKPIVFGLSGALTSASLAWVVARIPTRVADLRWTRIYAFAMTTEIALIDLQRWRGVASHFNRSTGFDAAVFAAMGVLILVASVPIAVWTRRAIAARELASDLRASLVGGLVLLDVGLLAGIVIAVAGDAGRSAALSGLVTLATALKPTHAIALHGIQTIPLLAGWLALRVDDARVRTRWIRRAAIGQAVVVLGAVLTAAGVTAMGLAIASVGGAVFAAAAAVGLWPRGRDVVRAQVLR